tara:strand:+ start:42 stop:227 length:186 start_codon:yes stop_codon:yes gene_type:complete
MKYTQGSTEFLNYVGKTLLPDLKEMGFELTANDVERLYYMVIYRDEKLEIYRNQNRGENYD